jgi:hypothetical protein
MQVEQLAMPEEEAKKNLAAMRELFKRNYRLKGQPVLKDMQRVYGHMQKNGAKVIDLWEAFKSSGLDKNGDTKIAISRADFKQVQLFKEQDGSGFFTGYMGRWKPRKTISRGDIETPANTFNWLRPDMTKPATWNNDIIRKIVKAPVPLIPPAILIDEVKFNLKNYYILWEVEEWKQIPPKDPMLLKQLTPNLYGVLATWDLTELERAIIRGRLSHE